MDAFLDVLFVVLHSALTVFNLTGWMWRRTRRLHLLVMSLTMLSWFVLGLCYGFGYCPCTDWHWEVKRRLGETHLPLSYVKYYVDAVTGGDSDPLWIDRVVTFLGLSAFAASLWVNFGSPRRDPDGDVRG